MWTLADPLYLVAGNDRRTEHYARWTVSTLRDDARNPFGTRWGSDLEELTIRHGWEVGWERTRPRSVGLPEPGGVLSHDHPEGRGFLPGEDTFRDPARARGEDLVPERSGSRSLYAPAYAPAFLPLEGQLAVFPRGDSIVVVATHYLPDDTTRRRGDDPRRPWLEPGDQANLPDRAGVFLVSLGDGAMRERTGTGTDGVEILAAPAGPYVVSVEAWSPPARRAGRFRGGLVRDSAPPDLPTLSDLLLVRGGGPEPASLADAARRALLRPRVTPGDTVALVWELNGLGWRPERVEYELVVERSDRGLLRRLGQRVGLVGDDRPLALRWSEAGPERPRTWLRRVVLAFPDLEPGSYRVTLQARLAGRTPLRSECIFATPVPTS
jgi:hypothetical protein